MTKAKYQDNNNNQQTNNAPLLPNDNNFWGGTMFSKRFILFSVGVVLLTLVVVLVFDEGPDAQPFTLKPAIIHQADTITTVDSLK